MFKFIAKNPKTIIAALLLMSFAGVNAWRRLAVDIFPDIAIPRVTIMTEAGGFTAQEVEQLVTIPIESVVNGIPGVSCVRSSSSGGLSFVWVDFDWDVDISKARFDVFDRLWRVRDTLPQDVHTEIAPIVSVTGEIMLVALTSKEDAASLLEVRELAEYDLRTRLMGVAGIGEVAVMGGRLPEYRIAVNPRYLANVGLSLFDVVEASRDSRTYLSGGYLADVAGDEVPLRQVARADSLEAIRSSPVMLPSGASLRLGDVADVTVAGEPRRGSASFNGRQAVVLSIQKVPGGNTPELTREVEKVLADFSKSVKSRGIEVHLDAYRQADFIDSSIDGGKKIVRDAIIIVVAVLLITLLELRTLLVVLFTMPVSILLGISLFPLFGLGVNVMTLGGFAIAAGDIVDGAIIFTEVIRRRLGENAALDISERKPRHIVIHEASLSVAPSVVFSTFIVVLVFLPLMVLSGLEGSFFKPLALSYVTIFTMSLFAAFVAVPAFSRFFGLGERRKKKSSDGDAYRVSLGVRVMRLIYRPFLSFATNFPKTVVFLSLAFFIFSIFLALNFGSSFLPPFREDSFNVMMSLPPGASLSETERISEAAVPLMKSIPGVLSVTRRTGRAERDQHAEPVSSSEFVVRVDLNCDTDEIRNHIRQKLGGIPGVALVVGYPIAHRISAVLSGTEAELAVNIYGEDFSRLSACVKEMNKILASTEGVADVRANREILVKSLRIDYDIPSLVESGITLREAGEQVSAAFNGLKVGEVRDGIRTRSVTVRLNGDEEVYDADTVKSLIVCGRRGRRVRLDEIARVEHEESPNLFLREGGRRKALISLNAKSGVDIGGLVEKLREKLDPIAAQFQCSVSFGGSYQARESAARRLGVLSAVLGIAIFFILVLALGSARYALLALINVPLALIGSTVAVYLSGRILSVSSLVGFITVIGFTLRNAILLLNCYKERIQRGEDLKSAVWEGSLERMVPIVLTSLTTVIGLVPIILAGNTPGGELLAPLAVVQFGGLVGSMLLNLMVLPASTLVSGSSVSASPAHKPAVIASFAFLLFIMGCQSYEEVRIDWEAEMKSGVTNEVRLSSPDDAAYLALVGNREINALRLKAANSDEVVKEYGWWEDPSLDFDLLRIVNPSDHPVIGGASLGFTLPLSGSLECEKKAARIYSKSDRARILDAERNLMAEAKKAAIRLAALMKRKSVLEAFEEDERIKKTLININKLHESGEVSASNLASVKRSVHARRHDIMDVADEIEETKIALLRLSGLRPGAKITVDFPLEMPCAKAVEPVDVMALVNHPAVETAKLRLEASDAEFEAEIRKQYPDLKLGPCYANEEGLDRIGLVAGVTLPLWNRNRKAIANAKAKRAEMRLEVIDAWRNLVYDCAAAYSKLMHLMSHPPAPHNERREADALLDVGELSPLDYFAQREEILNQKLSEVEWRREVALATVELDKFK